MLLSYMNTVKNRHSHGTPTMHCLPHLTYHLTAEAGSNHGNVDAGLDALRDRLAALPDRGASACDVASRLVSWPELCLVVVRDGDTTRPATADELKAFGTWLDAEATANESEYAGWSEYPHSGGTVYAVSPRTLRQPDRQNPR